jgi:hypothetical protein
MRSAPRPLLPNAELNTSLLQLVDTQQYNWVFCAVGAQVILRDSGKSSVQCGGWVEYLHRNPASRTRRRKRKSRIRDSKIWSWVSRDWNLENDCIGEASRNRKLQTHALVRASAPNQQTRKCLTNKNLVVRSRWVLYSKTDWPTDRRS